MVGTKVSMMQLAHPKVAQPKPVALRPQVCFVERGPPTGEPAVGVTDLTAENTCL